ncbi:MAG TPA: hypothetical protein VMV84_06460 [Dehalococcoidales bacterium]|nr:hypothetical protein [Dehalococcoidales bacterium]
MEKLDEERIRHLLGKADDKWYKEHPSPGWKYQEHLDFTAKYIAENYHRKNR